MSDEIYRKVFCKKLNYYMEKNGIKQIDIAQRLNVAKSTVSGWCTGVKIPRMDKIEMLAEYFGIMKSNLIEDKTSNDLSITLSAYEVSMLNIFRKLSNSGKDKVIDYAEMVYDSEQKEK